MSHSQGTTLIESILSLAIGLTLAFINSATLLHETLINSLHLGWVTFQGIFVAIVVFFVNKWLKRHYGKS
jgi:hypothetical protein